MTETMTELNG